jgi:hypothetical protein
VSVDSEDKVHKMRRDDGRDKAVEEKEDRLEPCVMVVEHRRSTASA